MKSEHYRYRLVRVAAGLIVAGFAALSVSHASNVDYKPASLEKGYCGYGSITISVGGKKQTVSCSNLDTYTGRGHYETEHCYRVEHGKKYDKHRHHRPYHHDYGYYKHCVVNKHHYQLPVIKVEKRAYDHHNKLLSTKSSPSFKFQVTTNGGYGKYFDLKSKQRYYVIPRNDYYTIAENAPHYKTVIDCGNGKVHGHKVNVKIHKPGQQVSCVFNNYKAKSYHNDKKHDNKKPKPKACVVSGYSLDNAKHNYAKYCHQPRRDCDPLHGKWYCSSKQIGHSAPSWTKNDHKAKPRHDKKHKPKPKPKACVAVGHSLDGAKRAYKKHCHYVARRDCDPIKGRWYCSSQQIGSSAPAYARW